MRDISGLRPSWKPGQSGNPTGRPKIPDELKAIRAMTADEVARLIAKYGRMTRDELQSSVQNNSTPMVELSIASIFAQCAKTGDYARLGFLFDRAFGKSQPITEALPELSKEELVAKAKLAIAAIEKGSAA